MQKEAKARIKINNLLQEAGWRFFDNEHGRANIVLENHVKITQKDIDAFGNDFEKTKHGYIDFLLLDEKGFPYAVLEAKSEDKSPLDGKEQARKYAQSQNVRFIILSNGNLHYFWDLERGNPTIITAFPTPGSLETFQSFKPHPTKLADEVVGDDYIVLTQHPTYKTDPPRWSDEATREAFIKDQGLKFLRPYQLRAISALQDAAREQKDRYLVEMATGTGKTLIEGAVIKLFLKSGNAKRILFLVDRLELEDQAWKNFVRYLKNDYKTVIYKENRDDWRKAEIVVTTVQSLSFNNKYKKLFSPTDFDLIISDEAHRSIGGNSRAVFEYFIGYKLGLTATPKDYLKKLDSALSERDPREWERRQLLDTYKTFGCESGNPTFRYSLIDGVRDGYLVNPIVSDARTEITTELLSEKGYSLMVETDEGLEEQQTFFQRDFEKKFFSEQTNLMFCKTFVENALKDPVSGEIGKSIVFCVSQSHASKITQILNEFANRLYPGKYQSDFAVQVTSNIPDAQQFTINFANNNLNGHTNLLDGYRSSKTRVCVTVGMMTTGYDCEDILNLCLMRPIFSPTDFIQMKGRGTRKYTYSYTSKETGKVDAEKTTFKLFDFFANCEYFEEKFNYDEVLQLPVLGKGASGPGTPGIPISEITLITPDPLKVFTETTIGLEGMKVDRKLFDKFEETVKSNPFIKETYEKGDIETVEEYIKAEVLNKPEDYITLDKLRKAVKADRRIPLREFIENILEGIPAFKGKDELLEEEYEKFVSIYKPDSQYALGIKNYLKAYITDTEVREIVETKQYGRFATNPKMSLDEYRELNGWRTIVPEYVKDYVSLNAFM